MAHESFEDPHVAALLNEHFVSIKVDREERPDIDQVYMKVCQMLTGSGGWPLTIVMTPEKKPFYAATYIPRESRFGRTGLIQLLPKIEETWKNRRSSIEESAQELTRHLQQYSGSSPGIIDQIIADRVYQDLSSRYDSERGGFGSAPKFPSPHNFLFLLHYAQNHQKPRASEMVSTTLKSMHRGGIYDQIGFGFHRYSTDADWLVPHFEKMLYDQAMMMLAAAETYSASGDEDFRRIVEEIAIYLDRDISSPGGAFYSAEDADSEGEEGRFYLWTEKELREILGPEDFAFASKIWTTSSSGNFMAEVAEHNTRDNILHLEKSPDKLALELQISSADFEKRRMQIRDRLLEVRSHRPRPFLDDKILTDTNALAIAALARAGAQLGDEELIRRAEKAETFLQSKLRDPHGKLLHRYRNGHAEIPAFLDDVVFLSWAELELYRATFEAAYLQKAVQLMDEAVRDFWDAESGGFFFSPVHGESLLIRSKEVSDGALPSGNSVAAHVLIGLADLTAETRFLTRAESLFQAFGAQLSRSPSSLTWMVDAWEEAALPGIEVVIVASKDEKAARALFKTVRDFAAPRTSILLLPPGPEARIIHAIAPFSTSYRRLDNQPTAYLCRNGSCRLPTNDPEILKKQLLTDREAATSARSTKKEKPRQN